MKARSIQTSRLVLQPNSVEDIKAMVASMSQVDKAMLSKEWLDMVNGPVEPDGWVLGFTVKLKGQEEGIGNAGYKGRPNAEGIVEIAYGIAPEHQGQGYATEAVEGLTQFAYSHPEVKLVIAHTLPETNASTRVLTKCGFTKTGETMDPEDGLVWRWEKSPTTN
jgi:ribosomal-protein-alanine N-acetyltransferase